MKRGWGRAACIAALTAACFSAPAHAFANTAPPTVKHVVLVLAPYLTWADVTATGTPNLWRLAETGAVGNLNARARSAEGGGEPASPLESAAAISAGNWAQMDFGSAAAYNATETVEESTTAAEVYTRLTSGSMDAAHVGYLGLPQMQRANGGATGQAVLGTLGQAIEDANGLLGAIGNSDAGTQNGAPKLMRPAAVASMDASGLVRFGDVSEDLLRDAPVAPYGVATDIDAFRSAFGRVLGFAAGHQGPSLIVLDPGDLYRARRFTPQVTPDVAARQHADALTSLDAVVGLARQAMGSDTVVIVASQAQANDPGGYLAGMGPVVVAGPGWSGYVTSSSTHRTGLVTNLDITATVLDLLGVTRPVQVEGDPMQVVAGPATAAARAEHLSAMNDTAISIDAPKASVMNDFIGAYVALMALAALLLALWRRWPARLVRIAAFGLKAFTLLLLALPAATWLMFVVVPLPRNPGASVATLLGATAVLWALALLAWWRLGIRVPAFALCAVTTVLLVVDQWVGAPLSFSNFFGYSPLLAARFYGMGNEASAILVGASLVGAALAFDAWPDAGWMPLARRWGLPVLGFVVVVTAAAPFWGANVGVAIWGLVGYVVAWALVNGYRITWKTALVAIGLIVLLIFAFSAVDLLSREPTHLARSLTSAEQGGIGQLWTIVARKAATNARVLVGTNWSTVLLAALAFLAFARLALPRDFADMLAENPAFGSAIVATLAAGTVAFFSEDSGIVIPSLILMFTGLGLAWLMLSRIPPSGEEGR